MPAHSYPRSAQYFAAYLADQVLTCDKKHKKIVQGVEVESEVDFDLLADRTAGYSGDDITGVCRDAAMNGMRRKIKGKTPEQIRYMVLC